MYIIDIYTLGDKQKQQQKVGDDLSVCMLNLLP